MCGNTLLASLCAVGGCGISLIVLALLSMGNFFVLTLLLPLVSFAVGLLFIKFLTKQHSLMPNNIALGAAIGFNLALPFAIQIASAVEFVKNNWILPVIVFGVPPVLAFAGGLIGSIREREISNRQIYRFFLYGYITLIGIVVVVVALPGWFKIK